jgi:hypothetical protein
MAETQPAPKGKTRRRRDVSDAEFRAKLEETIDLGDENKRALLVEVTKHDASLFGGSVGLMYGWLYLYQGSFIPLDCDLFGELAVRLGLLLLEYNSRLLSKTEDMKYTEYALKHVCIHIILSLVAARPRDPDNPPPTKAELEKAYSVYLQDRESIPLLRLLAMAIRHTKDNEAVGRFAAEFGEIVKMPLPPAEFISACYQLGRKISAHLIGKYGPAAVEVQVKPAEVPEQVAVAVEVVVVEVGVSDVGVSEPVLHEPVTKEVVVSEVVPEPEPVPVHIPPATLALTDADEGEFLLPSDLKAVAESRCLYCADCKGKEEETVTIPPIEPATSPVYEQPPQPGQPPEMLVSLTEGRFAGQTDAAVEYVSLETKTGDGHAWYNIESIPDNVTGRTKSDITERNDARLVNFLQVAILPIGRVSSELVHNIAYTLATTANQAMRMAILDFLCTAFITGKFEGTTLASFSALQKEFATLLREHPEYDSRHTRAAIAGAIVMQAVKEMYDADESAVRPLSLRYREGYGMLKHLVAHIWVVEHVVETLGRSMAVLNHGRGSMLMRNLHKLISSITDRRIKETLYVARLTCETTMWEQWKAAHLPVYDALRYELVRRQVDPARNPAPFPEDNPSTLKTAGGLSAYMIEYVREIEALPMHDASVVFPGNFTLKFAVTTPAVAIKISPYISDFAPLPEGAERTAELDIIKGVAAVNTYIDRLEEKYPRTELRLALAELLSKRSLFTGTAYECMLTTSSTPYQVPPPKKDYTCGGAFKWGAGDADNMQTFLANILMRQDAQ